MTTYNVPQHDILMIIRDMTAKVGTGNSNSERAMVKRSCVLKNDFCLNNNCVIGGTILARRDIHQLTWKSSDGRARNQIDHGKWHR